MHYNTSEKIGPDGIISPDYKYWLIVVDGFVPVWTPNGIVKIPVEEILKRLPGWKFG